VRNVLFLVLTIAGTAAAAGHEYVYTFWSAGKITVFVPQPDRVRTVPLFVYTYPDDEYVTTETTRSLEPAVLYLREGFYRLEADEELTVVAEAVESSACPKFFAFPHAGKGHGTDVFTGDEVCGNLGRAFVFADKPEASFTFAGVELLDPVTVKLPRGGYWADVTDRILRPYTYFSTDAGVGALQLYPGDGASGYCVPALNDTYIYMFCVHGIDRRPPLFDIPVSVRITAGPEAGTVILSRFQDPGRLELLWHDRLEAGAEYVRSFTTEEVLHIYSEEPVAVTVMPAARTTASSFSQYAHALGAEDQRGPSFGTSFRVVMRPNGYIRLYAGSEPVSVEVYDEAQEFVRVLEFTAGTTIDETTLPAGWYSLRSRGQRFGVEFGAENGGHAVVPRNPVADVIDRPLSIPSVWTVPWDPAPSDGSVLLCAVTTEPVTSTFEWYCLLNGEGGRAQGATEPSTYHSGTGSGSKSRIPGRGRLSGPVTLISRSRTGKSSSFTRRPRLRGKEMSGSFPPP